MFRRWQWWWFLSILKQRESPWICPEWKILYHRKQTQWHYSGDFSWCGTSVAGCCVILWDVTDIILHMKEDRKRWRTVEVYYTLSLCMCPLWLGRILFCIKVFSCKPAILPPPTTIRKCWNWNTTTSIDNNFGEDLKLIAIFDGYVFKWAFLKSGFEGKSKVLSQNWHWKVSAFPWEIS